MSQQDRDPDSPTYGCFDRNHWHFKMRDFASALLQQSALSLALLYDMPLPASPYYRSERLRAWAVAGVRFWAGIQHGDGAFDEYYPFEHGYVPTSFSLYAAAETCRLLGVDEGACVAACVRAAAYLRRNEERQALNQEAASIPALCATYRLTGESWVREACEEKLLRLLQKQSAEGFFAEYGGADLGYLSTTLDFLLEYWRLSGDERAWQAGERILEFAQYFVHQDGSVGGQYGSRNTEYFLLSPLCLMAARSPIASAMLSRLRAGERGMLSFYRALDDRYLCHNMLHSLLRALRHAPRRWAAPAALPCEAEHERYFAEAGLLSVQQQGAHLLCALSKGGVLRLFSGGREVFRDCGYRLEGRNGARSATSWLSAALRRGGGGGTYRVEGAFAEVPAQPATPWRHLLLRLLALVFGKRLIPALKKRLIFVDRRGPGRFARQVRLGAQALEIEDELHLDAAAVRLYAADKFSLRHVASSKYFRPDELEEVAPLEWRGVRRVRLCRRVELHSGAVETVASESE